ncbi:MAG TPA: ATP-binding cassette domain-containing protein, partial [Casimicrobiaceae bacterium]|nr:ATP-binding cassette domain-containing protein [Casimicrobiaceae bacterium]
MSAPLLVVDHLSKSFDGVDAVRDVSFSVNAGEIVAMIGPNGAGKTTCFNLIHGQLRADAGDVRLDGRSIVGLATHAIAHRGIARTFQIPATFASMTVREAVALSVAADAQHDARMLGPRLVLHATAIAEELARLRID